jgi:DNA mismatch repair protein MutS
MKLTYCISLLFLSSNFISHAFLNELAQENLKSCLQAPEQQETGFHNSYYKYLLWEFERQKHPRPTQKRETFWAMLTDYEKTHPWHNNRVLDFISTQDLNLAHGTKSNPALYLGKQIDRTCTELGHLILLTTLANPTANAEQLRNNQMLIYELVSNESLFHELETLLNDVATLENTLITFWQPADEFLSSVTQKTHCHWSDYVDEQVRKNPLYLELSGRMDLLQNVMLTAANIAGSILVPLYAYYLATKNTVSADNLKKTFFEKCGITEVASFFSMMGMSTYLLHQFINNNATEIAQKAAAGITYSGLSMYSFDSARADIFTFQCVQAKLSHLARLVRIMKKIEAIVTKNPVLRATFREQALLDQTLHKAPALSADVQSMIKLLSSATFKGKPSLLFSRIGVVLAAANLVHRNKHALVDGMIALGALDMYLAAARLCKENIHHTQPWCFPVYLEHQQAPLFIGNNFWNPLLAQHTAITNSIALGTNHEPRGMIITGPNAGGKSTTMKAIVICCILGQSLGIAPAASCAFTPFDTIMTYLNITDDIAAGNSHFKAGVMRAHALTTMLDTLPAQSFALTALDEVFNGTSYVEGQAAAYSLIDLIGRHPRTLCLTTTHFPLITQLESITQGTYFKNYKVSVGYDEHGKLCYPFKLEPGIAQQHIALTILQQEGFNGTFLEQAQQLVKAQQQSKRELHETQ